MRCVARRLAGVTVGLLTLLSLLLLPTCTVAANPPHGHYRIGEASNPGPAGKGGLDDGDYDPMDLLGVNDRPAEHDEDIPALETDDGLPGPGKCGWHEPFRR